jgi:hypothetical protein
LKVFEKYNQTCVTKYSLCATVRFQYSGFESGGFNEVIKNEILNIYHDDNDSTASGSKNFKALAKPFINCYNLKLREGESFVNKTNAVNGGSFLAMPRYMEATSTVQQHTKKCLMLHTNTNWFIGENHPISMEYYYAYERENFKQVILDDLFKKG